MASKAETFQRMWVGIDKRLPPESDELVVCYWGDDEAPDVLPAFVVRQHINTDKYYLGKPKLKYWMSFYAPEKKRRRRRRK